MKAIISFSWTLIRVAIIFLFSFAITTAIKAQEYCFTPPESENMSLNSSFGGSQFTGPYNLRIYVHVIRQSNGTGGQSVADVDQALSFLDPAFNPHDIYFVWDGCIDYIDSDYWFQGPAADPVGIFNVNSHTDGIDIYLFPATANSPGGRANGVGSSSEFWVSGTWPGFGPVAQSHILSHEMGHVLFLWHTHHGCESGIWELTNGSNCATAGDYVCDTPADPHLGFNINQNTCEWTGVAHWWCAGSAPEPMSAYNPDELVIMAYTWPGCMQYFTQGQGARMRDAIATLPYLQATVVTGPETSCACDLSDIHIYSNTTFSQPMNVGGNIFVHTGAQLTVTSTLHFGKNKGIIVERGAKLHVNGGHLTKCPNVEDWRGILVEGNSALSQPNAFCQSGWHRAHHQFGCGLGENRHFHESFQ
jgi:hypothetical protein